MGIKKQRPILLRALPAGLRMRVWSRFYEGKVRGADNLYEGAALEFAPGMRMDLIPGDVISDSIAFTGIYELGLTRTVVERARRGGLLVDVGANLGYFSLLWAGSRVENRCVAIEPSPRNVEFLERNVNRNGCGERVRVISGAAGKSNGKAYFDPGPEEQSGWGGFAQKTQGTIEVMVRRVDEMVGVDETVDLLKIDAEGADSLVLLGCEKLLREKRIREIWYEQNRQRMRALNVKEGLAEQFLSSVGYEVRGSGDLATDVCEYRATPLKR